MFNLFFSNIGVELNKNIQYSNNNIGNITNTYMKILLVIRVQFL